MIFIFVLVFYSFLISMAFKKKLSCLSFANILLLFYILDNLTNSLILSSALPNLPLSQPLKLNLQLLDFLISKRFTLSLKKIF